MNDTEIPRTQGNQREFERFQRIYPLFKFEWQEGKTVNNVTVTFSKSHSYCFAIEYGRASKGTEDLLDREHSETSIEKALMQMYPDLYISAHIHRDGVMLGVWVNRNNDDAEAIGNLNLASPSSHTTLRKWQKESKTAKQKDYFFCSGHVRAEPKSDYGYYHFAGNYCKQWGDEHPEARRAAGRETYE